MATPSITVPLLDNRVIDFPHASDPRSSRERPAQARPRNGSHPLLPPYHDEKQESRRSSSVRGGLTDVFSDVLRPQNAPRAILPAFVDRSVRSTGRHP